MLLFLPHPALSADTLSKPILPWKPGTLDIHQISTGRGNAALYVLPDGTTLLVDAGEMKTKTAAHTPDRPDASRPAGERLVRYLRHALAHESEPVLDYALLTHFHDDHMGAPSDQSPTATCGAYQLTGITWIGDSFKIRTILDRGWPNYNFPKPLNDPAVTNYRAFLQWQTQHTGLKIQRFIPGRDDQIVLTRNPRKYPAFQFRNVGANGEIWTGTGTSTQQMFPALDTVPPAQWPHENVNSISFRLTYGQFDFFNGGDIPGVLSKNQPPWFDIETPVAKVVGPVDAAILNHHGYLDSMNEFFIRTLRPRVWTLSVWDKHHPTAAAWDRLHSTELYPGPRDLFATDVHPENLQAIPGLANLASAAGHIVLRVAPGGRTFRVVIVDHNSENHLVTKTFGPYRSN